MTYSSSRNCFLAAVALLLTVVPTVLSFAPAVARTFLSPSPPLLQMALEEVNPDDPFDNYQVSPAQTEVAIKDKVRGTGEEVKGEGQLLQIAYTGRFMADGKQFDKSDNFVCKIGKNQVLPGFEEGVMVRRVVEFVFRYLLCGYPHSGEFTFVLVGHESRRRSYHPHSTQQGLWR
jgi:hypothetical protein